METCVKSELDLFQQKFVQTSIIDKTMVGYRSINPANESILEFVLPRTTEFYRDLSSVYLKLDVKLIGEKKITGTGTDSKTEKVACVNNLLHSLFSQIQVTINGRNVTGNGDCYPYRCFIETILNFSKESANTHLTSTMFYPDDGTLDASDDNSGFLTREKKLKKTVELYGKLHADILNSPILLGYGTELKIRLTRAPAAFVLLSNNPKSSMDFEISDATLYVKNVTPAPSVMSAHARILSMGSTWKYHTNRVDLRTHTISANESSATLDNVLIGTIPKLLVVGFVDNQAFSGHPTSNPFKLEHFDYNYFALKVNGIQVPGDAFTPNFAEGRFQRVYQTLFTETHIKNGPLTNMITESMFNAGYSLVVFDLSPDSSGTESHTSLARQGSVRFDIRFAKPLAKAITVLVYAVYDGLIEIDEGGNVLTDF